MYVHINRCTVGIVLLYLILMIFGSKFINIFFLLQDKLRRPEVDYGPVRNDPRCGLNAASRSVAQRRIVGGSEAGFGSFPWQAYIRIGMIYLRTVVRGNFNIHGTKNF